MIFYIRVVLFFLLLSAGPYSLPTVLAATADGPVVAEIAGEKITSEELDQPLASRIYQLEEQIYQLRKGRLDQLTANILLKKEAERRNISPQQLVDEIVQAGVEVTNEEIEQEFQRRKDTSNLPEAQLKQEIANAIGQKKAVRKIMDYGLSLREKYGAVTYLKPPDLPRVKVSAGDDPSRGPAGAPVTIIEFTDYECVACRQYHEAAEKLRQSYPDGIRWVSKDFPLEPHEGARKAAEAARCANEQGKFWEYRNMLFANTGKFDPERLLAMASDLGLDMEPFKECYESGKYEKQVAKNLKEGQNIGITSTPSFVVNGKLVPGGPPVEEFKRIIEEELAAAKGVKP